MPLARKAMVAPPSRSIRSISSARSSASPDSDRPHVRRVRDRMTLEMPARRLRSGRMVPSTIWCISHGTPGTAYMTFGLSSPSPSPEEAAPTGQTSPGAVPGIWSMVRAPTGTSAWRRLLAGMGRPRPPNTASMRATSDSSRTSPTPSSSAITSRVMSSWVGPRPPVTITASDRSRASPMAASMRSRLSPTEVWRWQSMPARASFSPIHAEFVSTIWPSRSSVPTATISQRTLRSPPRPGRSGRLGARGAGGPTAIQQILGAGQQGEDHGQP